MSDQLPKDFPFFRVGDLARHKQSGRVGEVVRFEHPGTDVWLCEPGTRVCGHGDHETGPYPQMDFEKLGKRQDS